jgi:hypothetical protein
MHSRTPIRKLLAVPLAALYLSQLGCGTVLYPDRRGQEAGRIDPAVVILDGIGLLFFFLPGVIAFAVDFATGAIYLPGRSGQADERVLHIAPGTTDPAVIARAVSEASGQPLSLDSPALRVWRAAPGEDVRGRLRELDDRLHSRGAAADQGGAGGAGRTTTTTSS